MTGSVEIKHPYQYFEEQPEIFGVDRNAVLKISPGTSWVDWGCGPGGSTKHLLDAGRLLPGFHLYGIDIDPQAIQTAQKRSFAFAPGVNSEGVMEFLKTGVGDKLPFPDGSIERVACLNAGHNIGIPFVLSETSRILGPGGEGVISSAWGEKSFPEGAKPFWDAAAALARIELKKAGFKEFSKKEIGGTTDDKYIEEATTFGLTIVHNEYQRVYMTLNGSVKAIHQDPEYATGLYGESVDIQLAIQKLVEALPKAYDRVRPTLIKLYGDGIDGFVPRDWKIFVVRKPSIEESLAS